VTRAGLVLFGLGLVAFVAVGLSGGFRLDDAALASLRESTAFSDTHRAALLDTLAPLKGRHFGSPIAFRRAVQRAIDEANGRLPAEDGIWDYEQGQMRLAAARAAASGPAARHRGTAFLLSIGLAALGAILYFLPRLRGPAGIRNDGVQFSAVKSRGIPGLVLGLLLTAAYVALYFYPEILTHWILLADPASRALNGGPASQWFLYGLLYTLSVAVMGLRMLIRYRHSRYHVVRTLSVIFFQTGFAFVLPELLVATNRPWVDFKSAWPLNYDFFFGYRLDGYTSSAFGWFVLCWGVALSLILVPLLAALVGKRWYCSWVCGCGGLAETLGDPFRHLSDKGLRAWRIERYSVHAVLVAAVAMTAIVLTNYLGQRFGSGPWLPAWNEPVKRAYGFFIGSIFAGVVGVGFYPLMGSRVWCRFGCPLAAILGIVQRFASRFRITTNGGQCISCGNCSTYCEMGIDVRSYAQRGLNVVRASCVGCGVCAAVCPRGVLRLENGPRTGRLGPAQPSL